jgi:hypothetical protein
MSDQDKPSRHPIALAIEAEMMSVLHPGSDTGNTHEPEWIPNEHGRCYLGVSTLVKRPAEEYATRIMLERLDEDESQGAWARRGNLRAWDNMRRVTPYRENRLTIQLDRYHLALEGIDLIGHMDGLRVSAEGGTNLSFRGYGGKTVHLTPLEHKDQDALESKVDLAARQAMCYSAMLHRRLEMLSAIEAGSASPSEKGYFLTTGGYQLPLASFHDAEQDPHARPFWFTDFCNNAKVFGAAVVFDTVPGFVQHIDDSDGLSDRVFDWAVQKAAAIMVSVRAYRASNMVTHGSEPLTVGQALAVPGGVMEYLRSPLGLQEFAMPITAIEAHVDPAELAWHAKAYEDSRAIKKAAETSMDEHGAKLCSLVFSARGDDGNVMLDAKGQRVRTIAHKTTEGTDVRVTAVPVKGGLSHYPKVSIREPKEAAA